MIKLSIRNFTLLGLILFSLMSYAQESIPTTELGKSNTLSQDIRMQINYWYEPSIKSGTLLAIDWEFLNKKGHGVAVTFPSLRLFVFPYNSFSLSLYTSLAYRFVDPKNGFYSSLSMGIGLDTQWIIVPIYNMNGDQITDPGFIRMFAIAQWDFGYDFEIKFKKPVRLFSTIGWYGRAPSNLGINSHLFFQLGVSIKLANLIRK
ncbi:MAG: hypothetical protein ACRCTJ_06940 [Brevinema sp.]